MSFIWITCVARLTAQVSASACTPTSTTFQHSYLYTTPGRGERATRFIELPPQQCRPLNFAPGYFSPVLLLAQRCSLHGRQAPPLGSYLPAGLLACFSSHTSLVFTSHHMSLCVAPAIFESGASACAPFAVYTFAKAAGPGESIVLYIPTVLPQMMDQEDSPSGLKASH